MITKQLKQVFIISLLIVATLDASAQKFDRGINVEVFVPKGQWLTGGTISYSEYGFDNYKFIILDDMKGSGYTMNISPFIGYFFKDNIAAGARFGYKRTLLRLNNVSMKLTDDLTFDLSDYYSLQHVYYGTGMLRTYMNIGSSKRFGLFNEVRLTFGGGQGKVVSGTGEALKGTYQDIYEFQLGLAPGLAAFITDNVAIEASVGVLGFNYKKINQVTNQIYEGSYNTSKANFKIDLFSISLGVAFYLPTLKPNVKVAANALGVGTGKSRARKNLKANSKPASENYGRYLETFNPD